MKLSLTILSLILIWSAGLPVCAKSSSNVQVAKLYPVDEAAKDPSFFVFRAKLLKIVQQRDSASLYQLLSADVKNSFGGNGGVAEFKQMWNPERANSKLWSELLLVLSLGGRFDGQGVFMAPYTFSNFPDAFDAFEHAAIIEANVRVRKSPGIKSEILQTLSFDIVKVADWAPIKKPGDQFEWITVTLADGQRGYAAKDYIRSPIDYRAIFNKVDGRWVITAFIAGD